MRRLADKDFVASMSILILRIWIRGSTYCIPYLDSEAVLDLGDSFKNSVLITCCTKALPPLQHRLEKAPIKHQMSHLALHLVTSSVSMGLTRTWRTKQSLCPQVPNHFIRLHGSSGMYLSSQSVLGSQIGVTIQRHRNSAN